MARRAEERVSRSHDMSVSDAFEFLGEVLWETSSLRTLPHSHKRVEATNAPRLILGILWCKGAVCGALR